MEIDGSNQLPQEDAVSLASAESQDVPVVESNEFQELSSPVAPRSPSHGETQIADSASIQEEKPDTPSENPPIKRFRVGHVLSGKYRLEQMIAKGGMGCVYLATQIPLGRKVAIKILIPQGYDKEFRRRFLLEASTCARLTHRHIVTVHDYGETEDGDLFTAMEYLDGEPLSRVISREVRIRPERACRIAIQTCRALRAAHRAGVVHRDLKPSNVMLLQDEDDDGNEFVKVLDFGLVKIFENQPSNNSLTEDDLELTRAGTMLGSPRYMAPEQIRCQTIDPRTDVYSLGIILYHMLAGRPPFVGANSVEILNQHLKDQAPPLWKVAPEADCPPELEVIVNRCMSKAPAERYQSMDDLLTELKAAYRLISEAPLATDSMVKSLGDDDSSPRSAFNSTLQSEIIRPMSPLVGDPSSPSLNAILTGEFSRALPPRADSVAQTTSSLRAPTSGSFTIPVAAPKSAENTSLNSPERDELENSIVIAPPPRTRIAVALLLMLIGGVILALLLNRGKPVQNPTARQPAKTAPAEAPVKRLAEVRLTSAPKGAEVYQNGKKLGQTPMILQREKTKAGEAAIFVFRLENYQETTVPAELNRDSVTVHATLRPMPQEVVPEASASVAEARSEPTRERSKASSRSRNSSRSRSREKARAERNDREKIDRQPRPDSSASEAKATAQATPTETKPVSSKPVLVDDIDQNRVQVVDQKVPVVD